MTVFRTVFTIILLAPLSVDLRAEILSFSGDVEAILEERIDGLSEQLDTASERFPTTSAELPIQAIVQRLDNAEDSAGAIAAQFADPTTAVGANPEEFAMNFSILTSASDRFMQARARSAEERTILFSPEEFPGTTEGDVITVTGQLSVDGALVMFTREIEADLSCAFARFNVVIEQSGGGTVFSGEIELQGETGGNATATAGGDFPANAVTIVDLGAINPEFGRVWVIVFNQAFLTYEYQATIGAEFTLSTTMKLDAQNVSNGTGCAGVIGTPFTTLGQVIELTAGDEPAAIMLNSITAERRNPTGQSINVLPTTGVCGLTGVAMFLTSIGGLALMRRRMRMTN